MTILLVGGGSGGHITPLLAVANELKKKNKNYRIVYVGETGGKFIDLVKKSDYIDQIRSIRAGKFRRYNGQTLIKKLLDIKTLAYNIRDFFYVIVGFIQSFSLLGRQKPNVVFIKGGFVGVPIGLACALRRIPFVTHDSDTLPGLANRIVGKWAKKHAVGMPKEFYKYKQEDTIYTGIPIAENYQPVSDKLKAQYRKILGIGLNKKVVCVTGGSLGAVRLNDSVAEALGQMLKKEKDLFVVHQTGDVSHNLYDDLDEETKKNLIIKPYISDLETYTGAADVIITRAGATTIAGLAIQKKPCIVVPNPFLTGGHQLKNAEHLRHSGAAVILEEEDIKQPGRLQITINSIVDDHSFSKELAQNISLLARPDAAKDLSDIIIATANS